MKYFIIAIMLMFGLAFAQDAKDLKYSFEHKFFIWKEFVGSPRGKSSSSIGGTSTQYYKDIVALGVPAVPFIMDKMKDNNEEHLWLAIRIITKKWFKKEELEKNNGNYSTLFIKWWDVDFEKTPEIFEGLYSELKELRNKHKEDEVAEKIKSIQNLGVAAIPCAIKKIEAGDLTLIPVLEYLTDGGISVTKIESLDVEKKIAFCSRWWNMNKSSWTLSKQK